MADHGTAIEWTHVPGYKGESWNPVTGCDEVSPGCAHCYAKEFAERWRGIPGHPYEQGFDLKLHPGRLETPLRWRKPRAVFVNSMSDLFHEDIPDDYIARVFAAMAAAPKHIFMVLTKRPERMRDWFAWEGPSINRCGTVRNEFDFHFASRCEPMARLFPWPLPNVWLGVSIENRRFVDRADLLRQTPAAVRFISAEPLLGPLVPTQRHDPAEGFECEECQARAIEVWKDPHRGMTWRCGRHRQALDLTSIDWLIVGGESGPGHRRIDPQWARDLRDAATSTICTLCAGLGTECPGYANGCPQCGDRRTETAFFFKQWGGPKPTSGGRELDGRTWSEWPQQPLQGAAA